MSAYERMKQERDEWKARAERAEEYHLGHECICGSMRTPDEQVAMSEAAAKHRLPEGAALDMQSYAHGVFDALRWVRGARRSIMPFDAKATDD